MSDNIEIQNTENSNKWINWIEVAIAEEYLKYYEYKDFSNIQEIGSGGFGKVFRANRKNSENYFALKSFFNLNDVTVKEIVHEVIYLTIFPIFIQSHHHTLYIYFRSN